MTRTQISALTFFGLFVALTYVILAIFAPFLIPILWAVLLVQLAYPLYTRLLSALGGRSNVTSAVMTIGVLTVVVIPVAYLVTLAVGESVAAYKTVTEWVESGGIQRLPQIVAQWPLVGSVSQGLIGRFVLSFGGMDTSIVEGGKVVSAFLLTQVAGLAKNAFALLTDFFVMLFTIFFLFRDGDRLYTALYRAIPMERNHKDLIFERFGQTVTAVVRGTILTAIAQGAVAGIAYAMLGVPFPVFLGAVSAVLALSPFGGTALVWIPVAVYLFFTAPIWKGIVMIAVGGGLVGIMDNVVQPMLIGTQAKLPVLFLFFASLGGIAYFGFIGLFLGPVLLGIFLAVVEIYQDDYQDEPSRLIATPALDPTLNK